MAPENAFVDTPVPTTAEGYPAHDSSAPARSHFLLTPALSQWPRSLYSADISARTSSGDITIRGRCLHRRLPRRRGPGHLRSRRHDSRSPPV